MSEEKVSFFDEFKKQILAGVSLVITAGVGVVTTQFETLFGTEEETPVEQVVQQPTQPQNITINVPEQKPVETKTIVVKEVQKKEPKKKTETEKRKEEGLDW